METLTKHSKPQKKQKATFGLVIVYAILFGIGDVFLAFTIFKAMLIFLVPVELGALGYLSLKALWNHIPKNIQKGLTKISKY
jgi:hypothetical protein